MRAGRRSKCRLLVRPCITRPGPKYPSSPNRRTRHHHPHAPAPNEHAQPAPPHRNPHRDLRRPLRGHDGRPPVRYSHPNAHPHAHPNPNPHSVPHTDARTNANANTHHPHANAYPHSDYCSERVHGRYPNLATPIDRHDAYARSHTDPHSRTYTNTITVPNADTHSRTYPNAHAVPHADAHRHTVSRHSPQSNGNPNTHAVPNPHSHPRHSTANP